MRNWLCALGALWGGLACADVQIFFSGPGDVTVWGVDPALPFGGPPANIFAPSAMRGTDIALDGYIPNLANFPAAVAPAVTLQTPTQFAYVWIKFDAAHSLPQNNAKLQGLDLSLCKVGDPSDTPIQMGINGNDIAYYVQDDTDPVNGIWGKKRWDGGLGGGGGANFKQNPQVLVAVTGEGVRNQAGNYIEDLYKGGTQASAGGRMALLGAVKLGVAGTYTFELGSLGISFNTGGTPAVTFGTLTVVPEPGALLLLGLAGTLMRRG